MTIPDDSTLHHTVDALQEPLGVIGTGAIAAAIVEGLSNGQEPPTIVLSPRNTDISHRLARKHPTVLIGKDNQDIIDTCPILLLTVPPQVVPAILQDVQVPANRVLISAAAGWSRQGLQHLLPHEPDIVRVIPLPAVQHRQGITAVYPAHPAADAVFHRIGHTIHPPNEHAFSALSAATATISSYLQYLSTIATWLTDQGLPSPDADSFVRHMFQGVTATITTDDRSLAELSGAHETPSGINQELRATWFDTTTRNHLQQALSQIMHRITLEHSARRD